MANSRQEHFILRSDVPIRKTNIFFKNWLSSQNADHVLQGELLVKEPQPHDGSHALYSLALERSKKVSCSNSDVIPLSEVDYEWLAAIEKTIERWKVFMQRDKFEAIKKLQVDDSVWVSISDSELQRSSYCYATVKYIGPLRATQGRWVGVELKVRQKVDYRSKEKRGSCDGSYRDSCYFMCEDGHGAFLPASNILTISQSASAHAISTSPTEKLLISSMQSKTDRDFYLDDRVVVFDTDGRRVPGVAKWTTPGKERGEDCYIIGIETDMPIQKKKVEGHISRMEHFFTNPDYSKHTYLAIPETSVLKEGGGTPIDVHQEDMFGSILPDMAESVRIVAATVAKNTGSTTATVLSEQVKALQESEARKEEAANKELADSFGLKPEDVNAQREELRKLERQLSENDQRRKPYLGSMRTGRIGLGQEHFSRSQEPNFDRQGEEYQPAQPISPHPVSHALEVGSAVELVDPPGYGTIRWIGKFPGVVQDIAGVELDKEVEGCGDGSWDNKRYFTCKDGHALFIVLRKLKPDQRFAHSPSGVSHNLEVGSAVELVDSPGYGTIRWIGKFPNVNQDIAGVELDKEMEGCGDGSWDNKRYFTCKDRHALFIVLRKLKPDQRFTHSPSGEPTVQAPCSCECQLVKNQVTEIKANVRYHNELIATVQGQVDRFQEDNVTENEQTREELATVKGRVLHFQGLLVSCEQALQAKDQQIEKLQDEVQALQETIAQFQTGNVTEKRLLREELATVRGHVVSCEEAKNQQIEELQQTIADLKEDHRQRESEFTARLSSIEAQMRTLQPPWAIPEAELEVTDTILGKGAYGEVRVGVYHGDRVAVKRLHNVIASDYYHKMIQREMGIAARLRHPKLVLFIGAVTRGNLTIVTELMETSLRSELEHGRLKDVHILPISRDVACALCYLHSLPEPIIHRDVSSANVLLNSTKGGWVAKLGDYGSANFQAKLQTVGPGCPVYAAPEAGRPEEQGPKMDVYSYGVLLLEMCTGTLPDPRNLPLIQQEVHSWGQPKRQLGELACQCTLQSSDRRPHMRNVVTQLNGM